jgi:hypothetical protein
MGATDASKYRIGTVDFLSTPGGLRTQGWTDRVPEEHANATIAIKELSAVYKFVQGAFEQRPDCQLLVIACDNTNCLSWIERRCAASAVGNRILKDLFAELEGRARLALTYVPSEENAADTPSRKEKYTLEEGRVRATWQRLESQRGVAVAAFSRR